MHKCLNAQAEGFLSAPSLCHKWITALRQNLEPRLDFISPAKRRALFDIIYKIDRDVLCEETQAPSNYMDEVKELFSKNAHEPEFAFCLAASQEQCYCSLYAAYEHLIVRLYEFRTNTSGYQTGTQTESDFNNAFGPTVTAHCWASNEMRFIKACRNALVHDGGRITPRRKKALDKLAINYMALDDCLVIQPSDNLKAYHVLKDRITILVRTIVDWIQGTKDERPIPRELPPDSQTPVFP